MVDQKGYSGADAPAVGAVWHLVSKHPRCFSHWVSLAVCLLQVCRLRLPLGHSKHDCSVDRCTGSEVTHRVSGWTVPQFLKCSECHTIGNHTPPPPPPDSDEKQPETFRPLRTSPSRLLLSSEIGLISDSPADYRRWRVLAQKALRLAMFWFKPSTWTVGGPKEAECRPETATWKLRIIPVNDTMFCYTSKIHDSGGLQQVASKVNRQTAAHAICSRPSILRDLSHGKPAYFRTLR